ncbi:Gfo/Idh/MocA family protein [Vallitalea okinawensis]|uniref:Gfo/Idh/MocA family protein n=1 Tax=Vallitalea okinawensis TaxID=2078660 RepID=UPI000CFCB44B|nr:Gfo/Idh/MocA family oxidoreductase [Vallitalea okinawensis]
MKVGILGTGFGAHHAAIYTQTLGIDTIKIFGRSKSKLEKIQANLHIEVTDTVEDILDDPSISLVDICLPSHLHKEYIIASLQKGKDVFCETPLCYTQEDLIAIKEASRQYPNKVFVNQFIKFCPEFQLIKEAVEDNIYGQLKAIHLKRSTAPLWGDLGYDRIVTNLMIHEIDFITWLLGNTKRISAFGSSSRQDQAYVSAHLTYDNTLVEITASSMMPLSYPFTVSYDAIFENASLNFCEQCFEKGSKVTLTEYTHDGSKEIQLHIVDSAKESIDHVLACLNNDVQSIITVDDAIRSLEVAGQIKDHIMK